MDSFINNHLSRFHIIQYSLTKHKSFSFYGKDQLKTNELLLDQFGNEITGEIGADLDIYKSKFIIYSIKDLLSLNHAAAILGTLINDGGQMLIEDPTYRVKLVVNPNKTLFGKGIYCYNHIVIARGKMNNLTEEFHVELMFHPPIQNFDENTTNDIISSVYFNPKHYLMSFVGEVKTNNSTINQIKSDMHSRKLKCLDDFKIKFQVSKNDCWVVISDILFTSTRIIKNLRKVFTGYEKLIRETNTHIAFILLGNFINTSYDVTEENVYIENEQFTRSNTLNKNASGIQYNHSSTNFDKSREGFEKFNNILMDFPLLLSNCTFFIVPGPNDIGPDLLPKNPLSDYYTSYLSKKFSGSKIYFLSNPSILDDGNIKMFLFRHSLTKELKEKTLFSYFGTKNLGFTKYWNIEPDILESVIPQTLFGQQHLTPTSPNIIPSLDHYLYLLPTPKILFIGDSGPSYSVKSINQIWIVNPGSFKNTNSWVQYNVLNNSIDHVWL